MAHFRFKREKSLKSGEWGLEKGKEPFRVYLGFVGELKEAYKEFTRKGESPSELDFSSGAIDDAVSELITNAIDSIQIKLEEKGKGYEGELQLGVYADKGKLHVEVEDNGMGIDPRIEPFLFQSLAGTTGFPRDLLKKNMYPELFPKKAGRGLFMAKGKIENLKGTAGYENKGDGKGAVFWLEVPLESIGKKL